MQHKHQQEQPVKVVKGYDRIHVTEKRLETQKIYDIQTDMHSYTMEFIGERNVVFDVGSYLMHEQVRSHIDDEDGESVDEACIKFLEKMMKHNIVLTLDDLSQDGRILSRYFMLRTIFYSVNMIYNA